MALEQSSGSIDQAEEGIELPEGFQIHNLVGESLSGKDGANLIWGYLCVLNEEYREGDEEQLASLQAKREELLPFGQEVQLCQSGDKVRLWILPHVEDL